MYRSLKIVRWHCAAVHDVFLRFFSAGFYAVFGCFGFLPNDARLLWCLRLCETTLCATLLTVHVGTEMWLCAVGVAGVPELCCRQGEM